MNFPLHNPFTGSYLLLSNTVKNNLLTMYVTHLLKFNNLRLNHDKESIFAFIHTKSFLKCIKNITLLVYLWNACTILLLHANPRAYSMNNFQLSPEIGYATVFVTENSLNFIQMFSTYRSDFFFVRWNYNEKSMWKSNHYITITVPLFISLFGYKHLENCGI